MHGAPITSSIQKHAAGEMLPSGDLLTVDMIITAQKADMFIKRFLKLHKLQN